MTGGATTPSNDVCPMCGNHVAAVMINVDDSVVTMRSCNRCDQRWWTSDGEPVDPIAHFAKR